MECSTIFAECTQTTDDLRVVCEGVGDVGLCVIVAIVEEGLNELCDVDVWCGGHW